MKAFPFLRSVQGGNKEEEDRRNFRIECCFYRKYRNAIKTLLRLRKASIAGVFQYTLRDMFGLANEEFLSLMPGRSG